MAALRIVFILICVCAAVAQVRPDGSAAIEAAWASGQPFSNATVMIQRGFGSQGSLQSINADVNGVTRTTTKYWERIRIQLPRTVEADHLGCLMVNARCRPFPVGATLDKQNSIFYWHVPNQYKGDFDLVFFQPGSRVLVIRV